MKVLEKVERRLGEKLFLKGDRCIGPKCAAIRRSYPPGIHGKKRRGRGRGSSEYGELLREKQKVRFSYSLDDGQIKSYVGEASRQGGIFSDNLLRLLERRLDVIVWRLGFAASRRAARQAVSHGLISVNGRPVSIPSYEVRKGDIVAVAERAAKSGFLQALSERLRSTQPPAWLTLDKEKAQGTVSRLPASADIELTFDAAKIKEFYSR